MASTIVPGCPAEENMQTADAILMHALKCEIQIVTAPKEIALGHGRKQNAMLIATPSRAQKCAGLKCAVQEATVAQMLTDQVHAQNFAAREIAPVRVLKPGPREIAGLNHGQNNVAKGIAVRNAVTGLMPIPRTSPIRTQRNSLCLNRSFKNRCSMAMSIVRML
jgi:hypothetical protein